MIKRKKPLNCGNISDGLKGPSETLWRFEMTVRFITNRKINLLLPDHVESEIRRTIRRKPMYWIEKLCLYVMYSLNLAVRLTFWTFILSLFVALYIGRLDWETVFYVWKNQGVPLMWVYLIMLPIFCVVTERPLFKFDVYAKYFTEEIEKRYGGMLDETVTLEELFPKTQSNLSHEEEVIGSMIDCLLPVGRTLGFEYTREILKVFERNCDKSHFEIAKRLLKQRGIQIDDYLGDDGDQLK